MNDESSEKCGMPTPAGSQKVGLDCGGFGGAISCAGYAVEADKITLMKRP